jgi:hypothetical protein
LGNLLIHFGPPRCSCDDQAAVVLGNGFHTGTFRAIQLVNRPVFTLKLPAECRLNGGLFLNFRPKKNIFHGQRK